jgi:hypothetical protein
MVVRAPTDKLKPAFLATTRFAAFKRSSMSLSAGLIMSLRISSAISIALSVEALLSRSLIASRRL